MTDEPRQFHPNRSKGQISHTFTHFREALRKTVVDLLTRRLPFLGLLVYRFVFLKRW